MKNSSKKELIISVTIIALSMGILAIPLEKIITHIGISDILVKEISVLLKHLLIISLAIIGIKKLNLKALAGLDKQLPWKRKYLFLLPSYLLIIGAVQFFEVNTSGLKAVNILFLFLSSMAIGFSEELVFRGFLQSIFIKANYEKKNRVFLNVLIPCSIFGLLHLLDFETQNAAREVSQFLYAIFFGFFCGALLLRTNKLIPLAIIHGLVDFVFGFSKIMGAETKELSIETIDLSAKIINAVASLIVILPLFIIGILVLRKVKKEDILHKISLSKSKDK